MRIRQKRRQRIQKQQKQHHVAREAFKRNSFQSIICVDKIRKKNTQIQYYIGLRRNEFFVSFTYIECRLFFLYLIFSPCQPPFSAFKKQ